jgi:crossover junction endonuclease EME1
MPPIEVIDLLSSPVTVPRKHIACPMPKPNPDLIALVTGCKANVDPRGKSTWNWDGVEKQKKEDEWLCLSDDDILPEKKPTNLKKVPGSDNSSHVVNRTESLKENINENYMYGYQESRTSTVNIQGLGRETSKRTSTVTTDGRKHDDYFYLSDDFDSTINLEAENSIEGGPAKKRKLSLERESAAKLPPLKGTSMTRSVSEIASTAMTSVNSNSFGKTTSWKRTSTMVLDDDPILFTSSPDVVRLAREKKEKALKAEQAKILDDEDDDLFEEPRKTSGFKVYDSGSDSDLPDISVLTSQAHGSHVPSLSRSDSEKILAKHNAEKLKKSKAEEKAKSKARTEESKEVEAERKRRAKEGKVIEKERQTNLEKVNILKIDKKVSTPEMIVDLPEGLDVKLATQARQFLIPLKVRCTEYQGEVSNVIKWRRKVKAEYNDEMGHWEPVPEHVAEEKHVLVYMPAAEFVELVTGPEDQDLNTHALNVKFAHKDCTIIYLIEGLTQWIRKNRNVRNRAFTEAVRSQMTHEEAPTSIQRKRKMKQKEYIDEDMVEDALLKLQMIHKALIHHTGAVVESAEWVAVFTQHVSTVPYRSVFFLCIPLSLPVPDILILFYHESRISCPILTSPSLQRLSVGTAFCMESGQVKTGDSPEDAYHKMLQEINRITAPISYGIASEYPNVVSLVKGFESKGRDMLAGLRKCANKDGAFNERDIGKAVSRRLHAIFTGTDEGSTDI